MFAMLGGLQRHDDVEKDTELGTESSLGVGLEAARAPLLSMDE